MSSISRPCPSCKTVGKLHKSHSRSVFEHVLNSTKLVGYYRCQNCGWRGLLLRKKKFRWSFLGILKTVFVLAIVYYIVIYVLKNYTN